MPSAELPLSAAAVNQLCELYNVVVGLALATAILKVIDESAPSWALLLTRFAYERGCPPFGGAKHARQRAYDGSSRQKNDATSKPICEAVSSCVTKRLF